MEFGLEVRIHHETDDGKRSASSSAIPLSSCWFYIWGGQRVWAVQKETKTSLLHAQQAELSALSATVFPALSFLHPAAVPLLSTSQISNDRRVCASCTKRACLWQLSHHLEALDDWRPAQVRRDPQATKKTLQWITRIKPNKGSPLNLLMSSFMRMKTGEISVSIGWIKASIKCIFGDPQLT